MTQRPDRTTLAAGLLLVVFGTLLLLDDVGVIGLAPGTIAAGLAAVVGVLLLVSGVDARRRAP